MKQSFKSFLINLQICARLGFVLWGVVLAAARKMKTTVMLLRRLSCQFKLISHQNVNTFIGNTNTFHTWKQIMAQVFLFQTEH